MAGFKLSTAVPPLLCDLCVHYTLETSYTCYYMSHYVCQQDSYVFSSVAIAVSPAQVDWYKSDALHFMRKLELTAVYIRHIYQTHDAQCSSMNLIVLLLTTSSSCESVETALPRRRGQSRGRASHVGGAVQMPGLISNSGGIG